MSAEESQALTKDEMMNYTRFIDVALSAKNLSEFALNTLPFIAQIVKGQGALLYINDSRLLSPQFFSSGIPENIVPDIKKMVIKQSDTLVNQRELHIISVPIPTQLLKDRNLTLYPLWEGDNGIGFFGFIFQGSTMVPSGYIEPIIHITVNSVDHLIEQVKSDRQLKQLNAYLNVSSMLAQSLGLHELLEAALYCVMDIVSAETASVLLLDDDKEHFKFYHVEGPAKSLLMTATFPADKGLAGAVLQTGQSEIINDTRSDPRFYGKIDVESGFKTRNMIAIPLSAGKEKIGVLEVINKIDGDSFTEEEKLLLLSIAEEIAFAIRNAKIFEYVADTYCRQRQGQNSCKGCKRPLGTWTPCVKYRELDI